MTDNTDTGQEPQADQAQDISKMPFEQALAELEQIVARLETGEAQLDQSITLFERGQLLKSHCEQLLKAAELRVEKIQLDSEGKPKGVEPLDGV